MAGGQLTNARRSRVKTLSFAILAREIPYIEAKWQRAIYNSEYRRLRAECPSPDRSAANFHRKREHAIYYFNHAREPDTAAPEIARNARSKNASAEDV